MRRPVILSLLAVGLSAGVAQSQAASPPAPASVDASADARRALEAEQGRLHAKKRQDQADAAAARRDIQALQARLVKLAAAQSAGEADTGDKRARLMALNARESELTARLGRNRNALARLLGALELYRRDPPPALLVHPRSAKDAVRAAILVKAMAPELERRGRALGEEAQQIQRLRRDIAATSGDLFQEDSDLAEKRAEIEGLIARKAELERSLQQDAAAADEALAALARDASSPQELVARLGLGVQAEAGGPPTGPVAAPVVGPVVRRFGGDSDGWSYRTQPGALVRAPAGGTVEYAGPLDGYGVILILRVGGGYHLVFTGLEAAQAVAGSTVAAGEPIGRMANSSKAEGGQTQPELYVEVRKEGVPVDPAPWLRVATPAPATAESPSSGSHRGG